MRKFAENFESFGRHRHFFYSCLLLFSTENQAVMQVICKRWLLKPNFQSDCDFILTFHISFLSYTLIVSSLRFLAVMALFKKN